MNPSYLSYNKLLNEYDSLLFDLNRKSIKVSNLIKLNEIEEELEDRYNY